MAAAARTQAPVATDLSDRYAGAAAGEAIARHDTVAYQIDTGAGERGADRIVVDERLTLPFLGLTADKPVRVSTRRHAADHPALGTGAHSRLGHALLRGVAQHVLSDAPSDVLVVPARKG